MASSDNYHSTTETEDGIYVNPQDWKPKPKYAAERRTEDDVYVNTENCSPKHKTCPDISDRTELNDKDKKSAKTLISALSLLFILLLIILSILCTVGIFYHNKNVSYELLSEQYANVTATLMMQENEPKEKKNMNEMQKVKHQQLVSACNETVKLYKELKPKHQELISTCGETKQLYETLNVKYHQVHERLSACSANKNCKICGEGWKSLGLKCYYFSTEKLNWAKSKDYCVEKGGHLVIITSQTEQDFISFQIEGTHWIGLNDLETEGKWMWVNNQPLNDTGVTFWYNHLNTASEPDNWKVRDPSGENCAALGDKNGNTNKWFDDSCKNIKKCICEKYFD